MSYRSMRVVAKQVVGSPYSPRPHAVFIKTTLSVMAFACALSAWSFDVRVDGLQGEPKDNVEALLTPIREKASPPRKHTYRSQVDKAIRRGLEALGYYQYEIRYRWVKPDSAQTQAQASSDKPSTTDDNTPQPQPNVDPTSDKASKNAARKEKTLLVARVKLGEPVRITSATLTIEGEKNTRRSHFRRLQRRLPKPGTQLNHGEYTDFKAAVERTAMRYGHFDGTFIQSELLVDAEKNEGQWLLVYDPKERYKFGDVDFTGSQIRKSILQNLVPFETGEPYLSDDVAELNRRLSATGWFNSIVVTPDITAGRKSNDKQLPVHARVSPKVKNSVETGLGYSTDVGPRGRLIWKKPWLNDSGHSLEAAGDISKLEQMLDLTYKLPLEENALEQFWMFGGGYKHEDLNDTKADSLTFAATRRWDLYEGWQKGIALKFRLDDFTQGSLDNKTMMVYPEFSLSRTRSRGGLMPKWGDSQRYTIGYANQMWGSDIDALMLEAQYTLIRTFARKHRFVLRSHLGWIETGDFNDVPPDLRYFAGGDRSIRGYDYESISPKDENGDLTGASKMITGSIEYQLRVKGKWWGAVFFDIGRADTNFEFSNLKKGAGIGVRWESPLGPIKLDIAKPVGDSEENGIQFYIGLGPEL